MYYTDNFLPKDNPNLEIIKGDIRDKEKIYTSCLNHDVFIHFSSIKPQTEGYKTLYQGEWVEFSLSDSRIKNNKQASNVTGPKNGPLLCDIRRRNRIVRNTNNNDFNRNNKGEWKYNEKLRKNK